jgi:hypothetical protein
MVWFLVHIRDNFTFVRFEVLMAASIQRRMPCVMLHCTVSNIRPTSKPRAIHSVKVKIQMPRYRQAGAKGERKYSVYSLLTSALDGGGVVCVTPRPRFT